MLKGGRGGGTININGRVSTASMRFERKLMMSPEEIETIIHMQYAQLHSNHPYTDDYYYYQLQKRRGSQPLARDEPPDIIHHHKPLCESTPTRTFPPKKIINDPLAGSLGRIPSHNVRYVRICSVVPHDLLTPLLLQSPPHFATINSVRDGRGRWK